MSQKQVGRENQQVSNAKVIPVYSQKFTSDERVVAEHAFAVFSDVCQPLMQEYAADIEAIEIAHGFDRLKGTSGDGCLDYRCRDYGWDKQIYVKVKLKNHLASIPSALKAWGHTLHFYLGGTQNPGYTIGKFPELCGAQRPTNGSYDVYISEPKLSFIRQ